MKRFETLEDIELKAIESWDSNQKSCAEPLLSICRVAYIRSFVEGYVWSWRISQ